MSGIEDFKARIQQMRDALTAALPGIAESLTLTAKALSERNIRDAGFGVKYSQKQVPAWFFKGKEFNQKGTKFLEDRGVNMTGQPKKKRRKTKGDPDPGYYDTTTNWGEFRQAHGLQAAFVDLGFTNKMWANMQPVKIEKDGLIVKALLGGTNVEAQNKMNWNRDRYGDFVRKGLTPDNGRMLGEHVIERIEEVLQQFKL